MFLSWRSLIVAALLVTALFVLEAVLIERNAALKMTRVLTRADLPRDVVFVDHHHDNSGEEVDEFGQPVAEMEHYATPEAIKNGGPIYGVYGYSVVAIEYEVPESEIGDRMVGKEFPGRGLASRFFGLTSGVPQYDHVHIGLKHEEEQHVEDHSAHTHEHAEEGHTATHTISPNDGDPIYRLHFMLIPHEEELRIGLSCD